MTTPRESVWPVALIALGAWVWLRDLGWWAEASDTLPVLAALPLFVWLAGPWRFLSRPGKTSRRTLLVGGAVMMAGALADLTSLLALGWTTLLWTFLAPRIVPADRPTVRRLLVLPALAFPWIAFEGQTLGWWFRLSAASVAQTVFSGLGLDVARTGTDLVVQGSSVAVAPACAGLGTLQAMLIAGCVPAYLYFGARGGPRYWASLLALLAMSWLANTIRVLSVVIAAVSFGAEFAMGAFHQFGGWLVVFTMFGLCCGAFTLLQRLPGTPAKPVS